MLIRIIHGHYEWPDGGRDFIRAERKATKGSPFAELTRDRVAMARRFREMRGAQRELGFRGFNVDEAWEVERDA